jgi:hypothetical protein
MDLIDITIEYECNENGFEWVKIRYRFENESYRYFCFENLNHEPETKYIFSVFVNMITDTELNPDGLFFSAVRHAGVMRELFCHIFSMGRHAGCA